MVTTQLVAKLREAQLDSKELALFVRQDTFV